MLSKFAIGVAIAQLFLVTAAHAESEVDCDTLKVSISADDGKARHVAYWKSRAVFPEPSKEISYGDSDRSIQRYFEISCPDFYVKYDESSLELKSSSIKKIIERISFLSPKNSISIFKVSGYQYPNIKRGAFSWGYSFDLLGLELNNYMRAFREGDKIGYSDIPHHHIRSKVIGYKVDGGSLKPLLYESSIAKYKSELKSANIIEIFQKDSESDRGMIYEKVLIDKSAGRLVLTMKHPFPES